MAAEAPTYESSTTIQVRATTVSSAVLGNQLQVSASTAPEAARLIETSLVANLAADSLEDPPSPPRSLLGQIDVTVDPENPASTFLTITASADDPKEAADIANAFADAVATSRTDDAVKEINRHDRFSHRRCTIDCEGR